jgi:phospho-N-acetylmuramoyl-pentapeptide-transferase
MGGGIIFIPIFVLVSLLTVPAEPRSLEMLVCLVLAMFVGFGDDRSKANGEGGWHEYKLGAFDLLISLFAAMVLCQFHATLIWLPILKAPILVPALIYIPLASVLIWVSINATNCTDGVDGLSGSLSALTFFYLGILLYGVVGHAEIAKYLLVPHYPDGPSWGITAFIMVGCLSGYVWYNAAPSAVLMGDAGSRPLGLLLGMLVLATGNPLLILVVAGVVLVNGATGLVKVALLRFFKIGIFHNVRYPLHDHVRHKYGWSNTHVLVRFMILQALLTPILLVLILKVR